MPHLSTYVGLADRSEETLADSFRAVGEGHAHVADVFHTCQMLAGWCDDHRSRLATAIERYGEVDVEEPERLHADGLAGSREGGIGLLRDLQDLHLLATLAHTTWVVITQGAQGLRDPELLGIAEHCDAETVRQISWLETRFKVAAPQALIVTP